MEEFEGKIVSYVSGDDKRRGIIYLGNCYSIKPQINDNGRSCVELRKIEDYSPESLVEVSPAPGLEQAVCDKLPKGIFSVNVELPIEIVDNPFDFLPLFLSTNFFGRPGTSYFGNYYSFQDGSQNGRILLEYIEPKELKTVSVVGNPTALHLATIGVLKKGKLPRDARKSFEVEVG